VSLRTRVFFAFSMSAGLVIAIGASSYWLNSEIESRVDGLYSGSGVDLAAIDVRHHGLEIEGYWDERGYFVAREVDLLHGTRRPKLRGAVQAADPGRGTVRMYGTEIAVVPETEFIEGPGAASRLEDLHPGRRIEISATLEDGRWLARKIKTSGVKISDKVKGTPTGVDRDRAGREFDIGGLRVVLPLVSKASTVSALRRLRVATLMTDVLQDLRSAAREVVGRVDGVDGWEHAVTRLPPDSAGSVLSARERLEGVGQAFAVYLDELDPSQRDLYSNGESRDSRLRLLRRQFAALEEQLGSLMVFAARDQVQAIRYLDEVVDPHVEVLMLPAVSALRVDAEETLTDQVREISAWAGATMRVAAAMSLLAVTLALVLGTMVWRSIDAPVRALHNAALRIGSGHLETRVELRADGEFGVLANAFNQMAEELALTTVSVKSLESIFDSIAGILVTLDSERRITNVNRGALELLGYERADLLTRPFELICSGSSDKAVRTALRHAKQGIAVVEELSLVRRDGSAVPVSFSSAEIRASLGSLQGYLCVAQDLSERKAIEEQVHSSLAEKELLLRELHHRVKNNMQVISSLLALQASYCSDPQVAVELEESQRRIQSMALIHEQLHHSAKGDCIDAGAYLESLTSQLGRSFGRPEVIETDTPKLWMGIDQALVCGLIVNELVTNALKHALGSRPTGRIGIALWDEDDGTRVLEVSDDGPGFIRSFAVGQRSLGLTLVTTLAKQLEGRLVVVPGPGTRIRIEFSVDRMVGEVAV